MGSNRTEARCPSFPGQPSRSAAWPSHSAGTVRCVTSTCGCRPEASSASSAATAAGKTTTVRILTTLIRPDAGRATVAGYDIATEPERVRARIGVAWQGASLDQVLTGRQNLQVMGRLYHLGGRGSRTPGRGTAPAVRPGSTRRTDRSARTPAVSIASVRLRSRPVEPAARIRRSSSSTSRRPA